MLYWADSASYRAKPRSDCGVALQEKAFGCAKFGEIFRVKIWEVGYEIAGD